MFVPQIPSSPSSLRVLVWRRMRTAGAVSLQQGAWLLPNTPEHSQFMRALRNEIGSQGGSALIFVGRTNDAGDDKAIAQRFHDDRNQEYDEFCEQAQDFLAEVKKETSRKKFSFAELEELEHNLQRLTDWLQKIQMRDFYGAPKAKVAVAALKMCERALGKFTRNVYACEDLPVPEDSNATDGTSNRSRRAKP